VPIQTVLEQRADKGTRFVPSGKSRCEITGDLYNDTRHERNLQTFARRLVGEYNYERAQLGRKTLKIQIGSKHYFPDIVAFHKNLPKEKTNACLVAEIETEEIEPSDSTHGTGQLLSYMQMLPNCKYGVWYNGIQQICFFKEGPEIEPAEINDIPPYGLEIEDIEKPDFGQLHPALELRSIFKRCHNYIAGQQGLSKPDAFHELLKLIFCKALDERFSTYVQFYVTNKERKENPERCASRINNLFERVKNVHKEIFETDEIIKLDPNVVAYVVSQLQSYTLINTDTDIKGEAYEEIVGENLRGDRGEFFTPRTVCGAAVEMLFYTTSPSEWDNISIIDPACGTGGFLIAVINFLKNYFFKTELKKWKDPEKAKTQTTERVKSFCERNLHGIDINPILARATQMNEVMHGNGHGNVFSANSLKSPHEWKKTGRPKVGLGILSFLFTNPPFATKIPITDPDVLKNFDLGHVWRKEGGKWLRTEKLSKSVPPEQLFIERSVEFLKPGGRLAMIIADHILTNPGYEFIRQWILENTRVITRISLPEETFEPFVGTKAHLVLLERKRENEKGLGTVDYNSFAAIAKSVGHDKRGTKLYLRTPDGREVLWEIEKDIIRITKGKKEVERARITEKVIDDDMPAIVEAFKKWWDKNGW